ncbi:MAG: hypothetical protein LBH32_01815 [Dysgonamonadaceae bacterium]|jgi:hypothetical protein|nr:hypothetical protein [Dysgonamonadaceae bacterium]
MSKRIAIQLFGHLRTFRKTYKSLVKNVIEANKKAGYEVDIFIHSWTETDHSDIIWHNLTQRKRGTIVTEEIIQEVKKYYNPQRMLIEPQRKTPDYQINVRGRTVLFKVVTNVAYTVYKSSEIRRIYADENELAYDYVIVTRPDILFKTPFLLDKFLSEYKKFNMEVPINGLFFADATFFYLFIDDSHVKRASDVLYFGNESTINKAANLYNVLINLFTEEDIKNYFQNYITVEYVWFSHWLSENLDPIKINYPMNICFSIVRTLDFMIQNKNIIIHFIRKILKNIMPYGLIIHKNYK